MKNIVSRFIIGGTCVIGVIACQNGGQVTAPSPVLATRSQDSSRSAGASPEAAQDAVIQAVAPAVAGGFCPPAVSPTVVSIPAGGGTAAITIGATSTCTWTTGAAGPMWFTWSPGSGKGTGAITLSVPANPGPARTATLRIASSTLTISQWAKTNPCSSLTLKPVAQTVPACGTPMAAIVLTVTASSACSWANAYRVDSSQPSWIYPVPIVLGGAGNGTLRLSLNANFSGATRTGSITLLAAGATATLTQPMCR
jgi:hypothetical protein